MAKKKILENGCTACVVLLEKVGTNDRFITIANLGDTRCVISEDGVARAISTDHKPTDEREQERIKRYGGEVFNNRVEGELAVSRSLGDFLYKESGVICHPEVCREKIGPSAEYLIIATDGIWDVLDNNDAVKIVNETKGPLQEKANEVID